MDALVHTRAWSAKHLMQLHCLTCTAGSGKPPGAYSNPGPVPHPVRSNFRYVLLRAFLLCAACSPPLRLT